MARQFEVMCRDGAARLGMLRWRGGELATPFAFESKEELEFLRALTIHKAEVDVTVITNRDGTTAERSDVDVVILGGAARFHGNPRALVKALVQAKESTNPDCALYVPALATPNNVSLLVYAGVDLVDSLVPEVKAREGYRLFAEGERKFDAIARSYCLCDACRGVNFAELTLEQRVAILAAHNKQALRAELGVVRENVEGGTLRELVEGRCRTAPILTALLRLLDEERRYFERRLPVVRTATLLACSQESLNRPEILRFGERVIDRLSKRDGILLLLPCSARKPYSQSRSHRTIIKRLGKLREFLHEAIITSPVGIVPRGLEIMYPASSYDIPVTGKWTCEETEWVVGRLVKYLAANNFDEVVAHVSGPYRMMCDEAAAELGIALTYTVKDGNILSADSLQRLCAAAQELKVEHSPSRRDVRLDYIQDLADYEFGPGASKVIFTERTIVRGLFPTYYASDDRTRIATIASKYCTLALTIEGARRFLQASKNRYCVGIDDFVPKGTVFAIGVLKADPAIRPFDEVIVLNERVIAVGRALMSGWEMETSKRGAAVAVRHVETR
jgi:archaeosine synthase